MTDMRKGQWAFNGEAIKIAADGQILDGQHRLLAVIDADCTIETMLVTGLPAVAQETMDQGRSRTLGDVLKLRGERDYFNLSSGIPVAPTLTAPGADEDDDSTGGTP